MLLIAPPSATYEGLVYWMLDKQGSKIGVPIKASTIYGKPTLKTLEEKFQLNAQLRKPFKNGLINILDGVLAKPQTKSSFQKALYEKGIRCILRENDDNRIYGVTFIDQKNKAVFNGSDLVRLIVPISSARNYYRSLKTKLLTNNTTRI
jgi:hypothetical protein